MNVIESRIVGSRPSPAATQVRLSLGLPDSNTPGYGLIRLGVCSKMSSKEINDLAHEDGDARAHGLGWHRNSSPPSELERGHLFGNSE